MPKKVLKDVTEFGKANLVLGGMTLGAAGIGANTAGLAAVGTMMRPLGSVVMAKHIIRLSTKLKPKKLFK